MILGEEIALQIVIKHEDCWKETRIILDKEREKTEKKEYYIMVHVKIYYIGVVIVEKSKCSILFNIQPK